MQNNMSGNPLLSNSYCYHSIGGDIFRFDSIVKNGILSQQYLYRVKMLGNSVIGYGHNGYNKISVIISPLFCSESNKLGYYDGALYEGITFVCRAKYVQCYTSGLPFEGHVHGEILPSQITGVILPDRFFRQPINMYHNLICCWDHVPVICQQFKNWMHTECHYNDCNYDSEIARLGQERNIFNKSKIIDDLAVSVFSDVQKAVDIKLNKENSSFADVVRYYIKGTNLKLYNREILQADIPETHTSPQIRSLLKVVLNSVVFEERAIKSL